MEPTSSPTKAPSLDEFLTTMRPLAPEGSDRELTRYWAKNYSTVDPKTLPTLQTFSDSIKAQAPEAPEQDIRDYWEKTYGDFGAAEKNPEPSGIMRRAADIPVGLAKGVVDLPKAALGLADVATGGKAGEITGSILNAMGSAADTLGLPAWARPSQWSSQLHDLYSPETKQALSAVHESAQAESAQAKNEGSGAMGQIASGAWGAMKGIAHNPSSAVPLMAENYGGMKAIAVGTAKALGPLTKSLDEAVKLGSMTAEEANAVLGKTALKYAAAGEGLLTTGQVSSGISQDDPSADFAHRLASVMAGVTTTSITRGVGKIPGLGDAEASMATSSLGKSTGVTGSLPGRVAKGALSEGVLQELPQSAQEQVMQNLGASRPWQTDVGEQSVTGLVAGSGMGGGMAAITGRARTETPIERIPDHVGVTQPTVDVDQAIQKAWESLEDKETDAFANDYGKQSLHDIMQGFPEKFAIRSQPFTPLLKQNPRTPEQQFAELEESDLQAQERNAFQAEQQAEQVNRINESALTIPRVGTEIPILETPEPMPPGLGIEPGQAFTPRQPTALTPRERLAEERQRILAMRQSQPQDSPAETVQEAPPPQEVGPANSLAPEASPSLTPSTPRQSAAQPVSIAELTPRERLAQERERILAMRAQAVPTVESAPSVQDLHTLAASKGLDIETQAFRTLTRDVTGKPHLDELSPKDRSDFAAMLAKVQPQPTPTVTQTPTQTDAVQAPQASTTSPLTPLQQEIARLKKPVIKPDPITPEMREALDAPLEPTDELSLPALTNAERSMPSGNHEVVQPSADSPRGYRMHGIPEAVGEPISSYRNNDPVKAHPDYATAKSGDMDAAIRLVRDLVKPETIAETKQRFAGALFAPALAPEASGENAIPQALAMHYAEQAGGSLSKSLIQTNRVFHTGADAMQRIIARPQFDGPVTPGGRYVLVDDVTTMGGTLSEMANHIQAQGGKVVGVVTLTNAARNGILSPSRTLVRLLEKRFGNELRETLGIDPSALTASEASYLGHFRDADALRNRRAAASQQRERRLAAKSLSRRADRGLSDRALSGQDASAPSNSSSSPQDAGTPASTSQEADPAPQSPAATLSASIADALRTAADTIEGKEKIVDVGEKVGGALVDTLKTRETETGSALYEERDPGAGREPTFQDFQDAIAAGLAIGQGPAILIDSSKQFPLDLMQDLAAQPHVRTVSDAIQRAITDVRDRLGKLKPAYRSASYIGLSPDSYYLGVNLSGHDQIIMNPWGAMWTVQRELARGKILPEERLEYVAGTLVGTIVHELTHQQGHTTHSDEHAAAFDRALAQNYAILGDRLADLQLRLMATLAGETYEALARDLDRQTPFWEGGASVPLQDPSRDAEPGANFDRQDVAGKGTGGRTGPSTYLRGRRGREAATLDDGASLQRRGPDTVASRAHGVHGDPSPGEAMAVQTAIEGKSLREAAQYLEDAAPSADYRLIAQRVGEQLDRLTDAGMRFALRVTHVGERVPSPLIGSKALTFRPLNSDTTTVYVHGADVTGYVGTSYETLLHELLHAATQTTLYVANRSVANGTAVAASSHDLFGVTNAIIAHFNARAKASDLTEFERAILEGRNNALLSPDEVLSWALTNRTMQAYLESIPYQGKTLWQRFVQSVRTLLGLSAKAETALSEVLRIADDLLNAPVDEVLTLATALKLPTQINQVTGLANHQPPLKATPAAQSGTSTPASPSARKSQTTPAPRVQGPPQPPTFQVDDPSRLDDVIRLLQDQFIDVKRVVEAVKDTGKQIADEINPVLTEEMYQGRAATMTNQFLNQELAPLLRYMRENRVTLPEMDRYLHARHAREANAYLQSINPTMPNNDALSGMTDQEADQILANAKPVLPGLAKKIDAINETTRQLLVDYGLESAETVNAWRNQYEHYVPLMREGFNDEGQGTGPGRSVKNSGVKSRLGSTRGVVNILANIALQRERTIARGEKQRPVMALAGLLMLNPNKDLASVTKAVDITYTDPVTGLPQTTAGAIGNYKIPMIRYKDPRTGLVVSRPDPQYAGRDNIVTFRRNGKTYGIVFNEDNARAMAMASSLKALDTTHLNIVARTMAPVTRYISSINTQYNPFFGIKNFLRDIVFAALALSSTPLAGQQGKVLAYAGRALKAVYLQARAERKGTTYHSADTAWWERFQQVGGQTGYRDLYRNADARADTITHLLDPEWWQKTTLGRAATLGGVLAKPEQYLLDGRFGGKALFGWLSDYNQAMENSIRVSVFKAGVESGLSDMQAASLAKNITVNFNKKGTMTTQLGALYGFFNASVQGTARLMETLFTNDKGRLTLSKAGKRIIQGGVLLGAMQAMMLAFMGFDDDEPPEFVRERNLVIPIPGTNKKYLTHPMPLGFHLLPTFGRLVVEAVLHGKPGERAWQFAGAMMDTFSPVGGSASLPQMLTPSALDPAMALIENKDWTGKQIYRENMSQLKPTPGHLRAKDSATPWGRGISEAINWATGGSEYVPGKFSPSPDAIDYLIAQATGGVGREISKGAQFGMGLSTGESVPSYKRPLVGQFYGSADDQATTRNAYYDNLSAINRAHEEVKGRMQHQEDASGYLADHPEARLEKGANHIEHEISALNKQKRELVRTGASRERVKLIEMQIESRMRRLNERMAELVAR